MSRAHKQTQLVSIATILLIVVVVIVTGRQALIRALSLFSQPQQPPQATSSPPTPKVTNEFALTAAKVGDTVAGLTVVEIKSYWEGLPPDPDNVIIKFSGPLTLQGYAYELSGAACFEVADDESRRRLPHMQGDGRVANFCFRNGEFAHASLQPLNSGIRVTVVIDHYTIRSYPNGDSANHADLVSVISKEKI